MQSRKGSTTRVPHSSVVQPLSGLRNQGTALKMASDREMLSQYIQEKEDNVASVLERLGWEKEYLEENVRIANNVKADARIQSSACSVI